MQHGGGSKDTWVLGDGPVSQTTLMPPAMVPLQVSRATFELPSRVADNLFWVGRYVERIEFAVRISRAILSRINQESDSASDAAIDTSLRILAALGHVRADATASNGRPSSDRDLILEREIVAMIHDSSEKTSPTPRFQFFAVIHGPSFPGLAVRPGREKSAHRRQFLCLAETQREILGNTLRLKLFAQSAVAALRPRGRFCRDYLRIRSIAPITSFVGQLFPAGIA